MSFLKIVICVSKPKSAFFSSSLSFLAEAQPRLKTGEDTRHFLAEVHINFFMRCTNYKAKDVIGKITNLFCIYLFQKLIHINNFFVVGICYQFANKTRNLLLLIYIIYGGRTIIGFVGFVTKLLKRPTNGATVSVRKTITFRPLVIT
jgi:hypothetical protein